MKDIRNFISTNTNLKPLGQPPKGRQRETIAKFRKTTSCILAVIATTSLASPTSTNAQSPINIVEESSTAVQTTPINNQNREDLTSTEPTNFVFPSNQNQKEITVPINVIALTLEGSETLSSTWGQSESADLVNKLNQIYNQYGINWKINNTGKLKVPASIYKEVHFPESLRSFTSKIERAVSLPGSGARSVPTIYVIKNFPKGAEEVATTLSNRNAALFGERSEERGKGSPAILAHELGHVLGLTDIPPNEGNLMSKSRPKGVASTKLYAHQLSLIRKNAIKKSKAAPPGDTTIDPQNNKIANSSMPAAPKQSGPTIFRQVGGTQNY
jgi:hypothetical protein